jgi:hypothetical protein
MSVSPLYEEPQQSPRRGWWWGATIVGAEAAKPPKIMDADVESRHSVLTVSPVAPVRIDNRNTIASSVCGTRMSAYIWSLQKRIGQCTMTVTWLVSVLCFIFQTFGLIIPVTTPIEIMMLCAGVPPIILLYVSMNTVIFKQICMTWTALFMFAHVVVACICVSGNLNWDLRSWWVFGCGFPSFCTIITSDAIHRAMRSQIMYVYATGVIMNITLLVALVNNNGDELTTNQFLIHVWSFTMSYSRTGVTTLLTILIMLVRIIFAHVYHPTHLVFLHANLCIEDSGGADAAATTVSINKSSFKTYMRAWAAYVKRNVGTEEKLPRVYASSV